MTKNIEHLAHDDETVTMRVSRQSGIWQMVILLAPFGDIVQRFKDGEITRKELDKALQEASGAKVDRSDLNGLLVDDYRSVFLQAGPGLEVQVLLAQDNQTIYAWTLDMPAHLFPEY